VTGDKVKTSIAASIAPASMNLPGVDNTPRRACWTTRRNVGVVNVSFDFMASPSFGIRHNRAGEKTCRLQRLSHAGAALVSPAKNSGGPDGLTLL
jgi:hypothetical protein